MLLTIVLTAVYTAVVCCTRIGEWWSVVVKWGRTHVGDGARGSWDPDQGARRRTALAGASHAAAHTQGEAPHQDSLRRRQSKVRRDVHLQSSTRSVSFCFLRYSPKSVHTIFIVIIRRNRSCSASDCAYYHTFLRSVGLSICRLLPSCTCLNCFVDLEVGK